MKIGHPRVRKPRALALRITCPGTQTASSNDGHPVSVMWPEATTTGGVSPVVVVYQPIQGSSFGVGTTTVTARATSSDGQVASCSFQVTVTDDSPVDIGSPFPGSPAQGSPLIDRGPIVRTMPVGAVVIAAGSTTASRQALISGNPGVTTFWLAAGIHTAEGSNVPKTGNTFLGALGAIIDGSSWTTTDTTQAVFRAHQVDVDTVTIENLVIRNLPQRAVHTFHTNHTTISGWTIEHCDIGPAKEGITIGGSNFTIQHNVIHECKRPPGDPSGLAGGAYFGSGTYPDVIDNILFWNNEIWGSGTENHLLDVTNLVFRENYFHDNDGACMWNDGVGTGFIAEDNLCEDNGNGVHLELSIGCIVRRNTIRRSTGGLGQAIYISTSKNCQIYENTLEDNYRGIVYFINCISLTQGWGWNPDLSGNSAHNNSIKVPATAFASGSTLGYSATCTGSGVLDPTPYINNTKNNNYYNNDYVVPDVAGFYWAYGGSSLNFAGWQALPQDAGGSVTQG